MAIDPEELVTLKNHSTMKLRSAVARTMMLLPQLKRATIVRKGEPAVLKFEQIKDLEARWEFVPLQWLSFADRYYENRKDRCFVAAVTGDCC
jgi:hypothetical protein